MRASCSEQGLGGRDGARPLLAVAMRGIERNAGQIGRMRIAHARHKVLYFRKQGRAQPAAFVAALEPRPLPALTGLSSHSAVARPGSGDGARSRATGERLRVYAHV